METVNVEIKSKLVEQTLSPLMNQITTLINNKNTRIKKSAHARKNLQGICKQLDRAVSQFVKVGEDIATENAEFGTDMREACTEARGATSLLASLTDFPVNQSSTTDKDERNDIIRAARSLLSSVTRVLVITDMVVVKRLISAARKVDERLQALESVNNFTEFVQAFSHFGADMVELAHLSGDRQNDLKDDNLKAEMCAARTLLEKSTMLLLTTSKTFLRHPDSSSAKHNREGVFSKMRGAMNTITTVAQSTNQKKEPTNGHLVLDLKTFDNMVENAKEKDLVHYPEINTKLRQSLQTVLDDAKIVADAPHTKTEKRQTILVLCENLEDLIQEMAAKEEDKSVNYNLTFQKIAKATKDLKTEVQQAASDQVFETFSHLGHKKSLPAMRAAASTGNTSRVDEIAAVFLQDVRKLQEVSQVARNMAASEPIAITAEKVEENIQTLCPHVIEAAKTLATHPVSKIAQENSNVFVDIWESQVDELGKLLRSIISGGDLRRIEYQMYVQDLFPSRLTRMMKRNLKSESPVTSDSEDDIEIKEKHFKEHEKLYELVTNIDNFATSSFQNEKNLDPVHEDLLKNCREMSKIAERMSKFLRGQGRINSSEELFFEAQRFAELGRKVHKLTAQFLVQFPDILLKKQLIPYIDRIPGYCQQLSFSCRSFAVGHSATYIKAGSAIHLTRNILKIILKAIVTFHNLSLDEDSAPIDLSSPSWTSDEPFSDDSTRSSLSSTPLISPLSPEQHPYPVLLLSDSELDYSSAS